jgi:hypothetical protein
MANASAEAVGPPIHGSSHKQSLVANPTLMGTDALNRAALFGATLSTCSQVYLNLNVPKEQVLLPPFQRLRFILF